MLQRSAKDVTELKSIVKALQRDADQQLTLEMESQQTFEYLASQIRALRQAFMSLSEILVEEVDAMRTEMNTRQSESEKTVHRFAKNIKVIKTEHSVQRTENEALRKYVDMRFGHIDAAINHIHDAKQSHTGDGNDIKRLEDRLSEQQRTLEKLQRDVVERTVHPTIGAIPLSESTVAVSHLAALHRARQPTDEKTGIEKLQKDMRRVKDQIDSLKRDRETAEIADTALAKDIAALATQHSELRTQYERETALQRSVITSAERNLSLVNATLDSHAAKIADIARTAKKAESLAKRCEVQNEFLEHNLSSAQHHNLKEDDESSLGLPSPRVVAAAVKTQSTLFEAKVDRLRDRIDDVENEMFRKYDVLSGALHTLSDSIKKSSNQICNERQQSPIRASPNSSARTTPTISDPIRKADSSDSKRALSVAPRQEIASPQNATVIGTQGNNEQKYRITATSGFYIRSTGPEIGGGGKPPLSVPSETISTAAVSPSLTIPYAHSYPSSANSKR